ncbi:MAG: PH domain-containing protein [Patescibacteria group bacterium]
MIIKFFIPHRLEGENIILLLRRHHFVLLTRFASWTVVAILPLLFYWLLNDTLKKIFTGVTYEPILVLFTSLYYLFIWLFAFASYVSYYLDVWVITNQRIIDMEQGGLFARTVSEQRLDKIQDITSEAKGFFPTILNYGQVYAQTAGEKERFVFKQIPEPHSVAKKLGNVVNDYKKAHIFTDNLKK